MKHWFCQFKSTFFYSGMDKATFRNLYTEIGGQIGRDNKRSLNTFSILAFFLFAVALAASFLNENLLQYRYLYLVAVIFCAGIWLVNHFLNQKSVVFSRCLVYLFVCTILAFAILLGTVYSPDELATTFVVLLIAAPLVFIDRPIYFIGVLTGSYVAFVVMSHFFKLPESMAKDMTNATLFFLFSIAACIYTMNVKMQKYLFEYECQVASETDYLTGLKNRTCFESVIMRNYSAESLKETFFVYIDANGLHELNNEQGHAVGDRMLKCVADAFRAQFGDMTFRVGGDEFVAIGTGLSLDEVRAKMEIVNDSVSSAGFSISYGCDSGDRVLSLNELIKNAELKMYESKAQYYITSGKDRRRRM